jgi:hypothetical protein
MLICSWALTGHGVGHDAALYLSTIQGRQIQSTGLREDADVDCPISLSQLTPATRLNTLMSAPTIGHEC